MGGGNRARSRRGKPQIREVWASNLHHEISELDNCLIHYKILSIDTEFPGFIKFTPRGSIEEQLYNDLRFNVTKTKLIQLGLTALDELGNVGGTWEFNFSDFNLEFNAHNPSSVLFLKENGHDFEKMKTKGIPLSTFTTDFVRVLRKNKIYRWITFHGFYDIGYLLQAMGFSNFPESMEEFTEMVVNEVGMVRDLKHMAQFCKGLEDERIGLERLGEWIGQKRFGMKHHAGSDSLLCACVHTKMIESYAMDSSFCDGYLYGISTRFQFKYILFGTLMFGHISSSIPTNINSKSVGIEDANQIPKWQKVMNDN